MNTMETIIKRQSCRSYKEQQITHEELTTILQAANAAPVGRARYENVKITVVQNKAMLTAINEECGKVMNVDTPVTYNAPTLIIVSVKKTAEKNEFVDYCNAACVIENMALAATSMELGNVYLMAITRGISNNQEFNQRLLIPEGFIIASALAVGYPATKIEDRKPTLDRIKIDYID